jgi:hypothetical protein
MIRLMNGKPRGGPMARWRERVREGLKPDLNKLSREMGFG